MPKKYIKKNRSEVHTFRSKEQIESQKLAFNTAEQLELFINDPNVPSSKRKMLRSCQNVLVSISQAQETPERKFSQMFQEYGFIQKWLFKNSKRPAKECANVWFEICMNLNPFSQDVGLSRQEIAANAGVKPCDVSTILNELASIGAVGIRKEGRETIYSINPQAIQNGMKFGLDIKKQYPLNLEQKPKNTKLKVIADNVFNALCWATFYVSGADMLLQLHQMGGSVLFY
ncbi:MAG: helix-turn-helix transcriptional regulator [Clostridia bacterium]|nr:helix-turn-helix transcriptional regulator [Clostridia bacterium]